MGLEERSLQLSVVPVQSYLWEEHFPFIFLIDSILLFLNNHIFLKSHLSGCINLAGSSGCLFLPEYFLHAFVNSLMKTPFVIYLDMLEPERSHLCLSFLFLFQILSHNRLK